MKPIMNNSLRILVMVLTLCVVDSCSKEPFSRVKCDRTRPLGVTAWMDEGVTKGAGEITTASLRSRGFGLFAWWCHEDTYFSGITGGSLYLDNMEMSFIESTLSGDRWECSTESYWPLGCKLSFFAYAPYLDCTGPVLTLPNGSSGPMPRGTFEQLSAPEEQIDLCIAAPVYDRLSSQGDVPMVFNHALTKVMFYFNISGIPDEEDDFVYRVESLTLNNVVGENDFTYGNASKGFRWNDLPRTDLSSRTASYTLTRAAGNLVDLPLIHVDDLTSETGLDRYVCVNDLPEGFLYLLPQPMTGGSTVTVTIWGYSVEAGNLVHRTSLSPFTLTLPEETVWDAGDRVAYSATLDITRWDDIINFSATVTPWGERDINPSFWDNAVYLTRSDLTFSIASVGAEWSCGDLAQNPPALYVNGTLTSVLAWTRVSETVLTAEIATGTFTFTLVDGSPTAVSYLAS